MPSLVAIGRFVWMTNPDTQTDKQTDRQTDRQTERLNFSSFSIPLFFLSLFFFFLLFFFLCRLLSIAAQRDHFVRRLSVRLSVCLSVCHTFYVVTLSYKSDPYVTLCFAGDTCIPRNAATIFICIIGCCNFSLHTDSLTKYFYFNEMYIFIL